ncbi:MAG: sugar transferase [Armatimonadota bacterium]
MKLKRSFDIMISSVAIVLLLPFLFIVAGLVAVSMGFPVLFCQERPGRNGKIFKMYKFRTMRNTYDKAGKPLPDAQRLTRLGRLLRATSVDELPELFNVLKGNMSLVGPRPLLPKYMPYYTDRERLRHSVRPGITGYAQIKGRNTLCWDERLAYDVWYVENWSFGLDIKILFNTLLAVFIREGVVVDAQSVMMNLDEERCAATRRSKGGCSD